MTYQETMEAARRGNINASQPAFTPQPIRAVEEDPSYAMAKQEADIAMGRPAGAPVVPLGQNAFTDPAFKKNKLETDLAMGRSDVPESVTKYQKDIEEARLPKDPYGVDKYQRDIEAKRLQPSKAMPDAAEIAQLKTPKASAIELAGAKPSNAAAVIAKLKEEEKKGGPNFLDIIQAAAAGWNGQIPAYVKKAMAEDEQKKTLERMQVQQAAADAERQANFADTQRLQQQNRDYDTSQFNQEMALKREAAGLAPLTLGAGTNKGSQLAKLMLSGSK